MGTLFSPCYWWEHCSTVTHGNLSISPVCWNRKKGLNATEQGWSLSNALLKETDLGLSDNCDAPSCGISTTLTSVQFGFLFCEWGIIIFMYFAGSLWELKFIYIKCFAYTRCSVIVARVSIITISWDLVPSYECLFSCLPTHERVRWKIRLLCGSEGQSSPIFWFVRIAGFIHILTLQNDYFTPSLFFTNFCHLLSCSNSHPYNLTEKIEAMKWISTTFHHHIYPSTYTSISTQMLSLL